MKITVPMELNDKEEIFTHKDDNGVLRHFPVRIMFEAAEKYMGRCKDIIHAFLPLDPNTAVFIRKQMGIEQERLDRFTAEYLFRPMVGILWEDNRTMTVVDGNHRYIKLLESGVEKGKFHVFKFGFWQQFCLPLNYGEEKLTGRSMMLEYEAQLDRIKCPK